MVYRIYSEKRSEHANEAKALLNDLRSVLGIKGIETLRILNRYDAEGISRELFLASVPTVFSVPQTDDAYETPVFEENEKVFATEYLPGQFDQRADSAAQCIQLISKAERPEIRTAKVYVIGGNVSDEDIEAIKKYVINPVESREASLDTRESLKMVHEEPEDVATVTGFRELEGEAIAEFIKKYGLAMDCDDAAFCRDYFKKEGRDPSIAEIRMADTYWSDHCRHTTFLTTVDSVKFEDPFIEASYNEYLKAREALGRTAKPKNLMDIATIAAKCLKAEGKLDSLDESEEINACTVKIEIDVDGEKQDWLLLFKNETHNHPTEIEPFGGAATCIGGAIRDPLSGRSYVYAAMRVTGASDPTVPLSATLPGKLPQKKLVATAAHGYSSYGNQIGLATGQVDEVYHPGYVAKHMEIGAVLGAAPRENVRRECPAPGDVVILLGGRTGRDGIGGATGSSKSHTSESLSTCGAEVQKGNAPEERKLQRLFRNKAATELIKRCNDFGAGGVSVAVGELADGLKIDLDRVPKKYEGLDGMELAISESQERMAVVVAKEDAEKFKALAETENLEATEIAVVTEEKRLTMTWRGKTVIDLSREFLNSNGAEKHIDIEQADLCPKDELYKTEKYESFKAMVSDICHDLNICSKRGLAERFDSTIGAGTVMMPFGGKYQLTPSLAMVHKIPLEKGFTDDCSFMAWGFDPTVSERSPYHGAYLAVVESVAKLVATGADHKKVWLTFQEYFEKPLRDPKRWGKPLSALLGSFKAQLDLESASIGGKDSMSGSFDDIDVPPTLVSFAVSVGKTGDVISPEFKFSGSSVVMISPEYGKDGLPVPESLKACMTECEALIKKGAAAVSTPTKGGIIASLIKMCLGNKIGVKIDSSLSLEKLNAYSYGSFIAEVPAGTDCEGWTLIGETGGDSLSFGAESISLTELLSLYEEKLEKVYPAYTEEVKEDIPCLSFKADKSAYPAPSVRTAAPRVLIPVFPGTNCEFDTARAFREAGAEPEIFVINNLSSAHVADSVERFARSIDNSQIVFIPGGFSGGDEPDGSGKFIAAFFRNDSISRALSGLLDGRGGLMGGICNGFQALVQLGLLPYGKICDMDESCPVLTFNRIGRHQSRIVNTVVSSDKSPWFKYMNVGEIYQVPISHGEGRFCAPKELLLELGRNGQVITQYCDGEGVPTYDILCNPNASAFAIEGVCSPDGRIFGKMGHSERIGKGLYVNVPGNYDSGLFKSAVEFFK